MKTYIQQENIIDIEAEALIYSTNRQLSLSGGVGWELRSKYGYKIEVDTFDQFRDSTSEMIKVGDVIKTEFDYVPWKMIFHTIATNDDYFTDPGVVSSILDKCFRVSSELGFKSIVCSPLGAGYGDLRISMFCEILNQKLGILGRGECDRFTICCNDEDQIGELKDGLGADWEFSER